MSQIEKINRERDSMVAASVHHGKKYGNGVVSRTSHSGDSSKSKDSKHKIPEEGVKGKTKSSTINEETRADPALDVLAASRYYLPYHETSTLLLLLLSMKIKDYNR